MIEVTITDERGYYEPLTFDVEALVGKTDGTLRCYYQEGCGYIIEHRSWFWRGDNWINVKTSGEKVVVTSYFMMLVRRFVAKCGTINK